MRWPNIGIERTFAIQALTLPLALAGDDLIGQARTGMGKTFGFGVPLLQRLTTTPPHAERHSPRARHRADPRAVPAGRPATWLTRRIPRPAIASVRLSIYGGRAYEPQIDALQAGVDVVVGTPGRLLDLASRATWMLGGITCWCSTRPTRCSTSASCRTSSGSCAQVPDQRQTMLFSATMPGPIITLARTLHAPARRTSGPRRRDERPTARTTEQFVYRAHALDKVEMVARVLQARAAA